MNDKVTIESFILEKLAAGVSALVLAALALIFCMDIKIAPNYTDFIVGNIAWQSSTKFQDLIAAPIFIAVLFFGFLFLSLQLVKQKEQFGRDHSIKLSNQLLWWSVPSFAAICSLILGATIDKTLFITSVIGIIFVAIASAYNVFRLTNISPELIGLSVFAIVLMGLIPLEVALILGRMPIKLIGIVDLNQYKMVTNIIVGFGLCIGLFYAIRSPEILLHGLPKLLLVGQIGLPTLFLTLYPARFFQSTGVIAKYQTTWGLKFFIAVIIIVGILDVVRRYKKFSTVFHGDWVNLLSPMALFALLVALQVGNTVSPHISPDDYHFGEILLGWWSYLHGAIPYIGYLPPHGIIPDDLAAFISFTFYDGTAGSFVEAGRLSYALLAFATLMSIYRFSGSVGLAFVVTFSAGGNSTFLFFTPFLCLWFSHALRENPARWLSIWMLTAPIVILGVPGQGLLLVAASGVMTVNFAWRIWQNPKERVWRDIGISIAILIVFGLATPLAPMLLGAIGYVIENGAINQVAYGKSWAQSWNAGANAGFVFEAIRMSWVAVPVACLTIIYVSIKNREARKDALFPALVVLLITMLLIPYSMGRIDSGVLSRPGYATNFAWSILFPLAVWRVLKHSYRVPLILFVAGMSATLNLTTLSFPNLVSAASSHISIGPLKDGYSVGLSNIGIASVQDEHWDRLTRLNALLDSKLAPNEGYLDLTSRNAQYFYLNRRPMTSVTAPYNMVLPSQQKREVEQLSRKLPRLALLDAANINHDGGGLALRNPYLYRFIIDNYTPSLQRGFIIGEVIMKEGINHTSTIDVSLKNITNDNWDRGVNRLNSSIIIDDPVLFSLLSIENYVRIGGGEPRKILNINRGDGSLVLEGGGINPASIGYPGMIDVVVSPQLEYEYRAALFQRAFSTSDFQKIPVSWGKSKESLGDRMTLIGNLNAVTPILNQVIYENERYEVNGADPYLIFDFSKFGLSGHDAGILKFDFSCNGRTAEPRMQIFWWGDEHSGPSESFSIKFTADDGALIIPLDSSALWLTMKNINGIRIDLDNSASCSSFSVKDVGLFQRIF